MQKKYKIHVKVGDTVKIISGQNKGKIGTINKIIHNTNRIIVKDINIIKKHIKPKNQNDKGKIASIEAPIHSSNVKIYLQNS